MRFYPLHNNATIIKFREKYLNTKHDAAKKNGTPQNIYVIAKCVRMSLAGVLSVFVINSSGASWGWYREIVSEAPIGHLGGSLEFSGARGLCFQRAATSKHGLRAFKLVLQPALCRGTGRARPMGYVLCRHIEK